MKQLLPWMLVIVVIAIALAVQPARALPEYATQTGEPCASCHASASGGGLRTPRGQAWVAAGKPGAVPALAESLDLLGVHIEIDESAYVAPGGPVPAASPLQLKHGQAAATYRRLSDYPGN